MIFSGIDIFFGQKIYLSAIFSGIYSWKSSFLRFFVDFGDICCKRYIFSCFFRNRFIFRPKIYHLPKNWADYSQNGWKIYLCGKKIYINQFCVKKRYIFLQNFQQLLLKKLMKAISLVENRRNREITEITLHLWIISFKLEDISQICRYKSERYLQTPMIYLQKGERYLHFGDISTNISPKRRYIRNLCPKLILITTI